jgi:hypothetical protein
MPFRARKEHSGKVEEGVSPVGRFYLPGDAQGAAFVRKKFDGYIRRLCLGTMLLRLLLFPGLVASRSSPLGVPLLARPAAPVIGTARTTLAPVWPFATLRLASAGNIPPAPVIPLATLAATGPLPAAWSLAYSRSAPAVIRPSPASPLLAETPAGAPVIVTSLVVRIRILRGRLLEPVRH